MKTEAQAKIDALLNEANAKIGEAMTIADDNGIIFNWEPEHIGNYHGKGSTELHDEPLSEGEWSPSYWSSSSIYC